METSQTPAEIKKTKVTTSENNFRERNFENKRKEMLQFLLKQNFNYRSNNLINLMYIIFRNRDDLKTIEILNHEKNEYTKKLIKLIRIQSNYERKIKDCLFQGENEKAMEMSKINNEMIKTLLPEIEKFIEKYSENI